VKEIPEIKAEYRALKQAYRTVLGSPAAQPILDDLAKQFNKTSLKKVEGVLDINASIAAAGAREVLLYIDIMMKELRENNAT
jgi:hypothetical protein